MKKAADVRAFGRARASRANHTSDPPATRKAAPISRMKWALNGPVSGTPGTMAYHAAGAASMNTPLAAAKRPSTQASFVRMVRFLAITRRGRHRICDNEVATRRSHHQPYQVTEVDGPSFGSGAQGGRLADHLEANHIQSSRTTPTTDPPSTLG